MRKTSVLFILAKNEAPPFNGIYVINHLGPSVQIDGAAGKEILVSIPQRGLQVITDRSGTMKPDNEKIQPFTRLDFSFHYFLRTSSCMAYATPCSLLERV